MKIPKYIDEALWRASKQFFILITDTLKPLLVRGMEV